MLDTSNAIRTVYLNKLNGFLTYDGKNVPVYGNKVFKTVPKRYVIIGDISENANNNNHLFMSNIDVVIDIFAEQYMTYDNAVVDDIASQILNILIPSPAVVNIGDANFEIYPTARIASRYLPLESGQNFIARKIITISNLVNQK
jgi:hypothetical protein